MGGGLSHRRSLAAAGLGSGSGVRAGGFCAGRLLECRAARARCSSSEVIAGSALLAGRVKLRVRGLASGPTSGLGLGGRVAGAD